MKILFLSLIPALSLAFYAFLALITWRQGLAERVNQRFLLYLLSMTVWSLGALMMYLDRSRSPFWNRIMLVGMSAMPVAFFGFVHAFRGETKYDTLLRLGILGAAVFAILGLKGYLVGGIHVDSRGLIEFELRTGIYFFGIYFFSLLCLSALLLFLGWRETRDYVQRNRYLYVLLGLGVVLAGILTNSIGRLGAYPLDIAANTWNAILLSYTIFRYKLLDISIVIRKGLLYTIPTVMIAATYLLLIFLVVNLIDDITGTETMLLSVAMAVLVALVMQPAQERAQHWLDRLFFREKYDANLMLQRVSHSAASMLQLQKLSAMLLDELTETMHIAKAAFFLRDERSGIFEMVGQRGLLSRRSMVFRPDHPVVRQLQRSRRPLTLADLELLPQFKALWATERQDLQWLEAMLFVPVLGQTTLNGILVLGPKHSGMTYTMDEELLLETLANQVAIAVQNARLYRQVSEEKQRAEVILEQAFTGIMVADTDLRILDANRAASAITGIDRETLLGMTVLRLFHNVLAHEATPLRQAITSWQAMEPQEIRLAEPARPRDILLGVTPIQDRLLFNFTDVTSLKELARLQSNVVANVSHELRTPLSSIKGYADLLLNGADRLNDELREQCVQIINSEADRMTEVVNALLDLSRLEAEKGEEHMTWVDIPEFVRQIGDAMQVQADQAHVRLLCTVDDAIPPLLAHENLLKSIFANLLSNAIKYNREGGEVQLSVAYRQGQLHISVADTGIGIAEEDMPHLFSKFYRSHRAQEAGIRGTGLGLALVKDAVDAHHGEINVRSEVGKGSTFYVYLPLRPAENHHRDQSTPLPSSTTPR